MHRTIVAFMLVVVACGSGEAVEQATPGTPESPRVIAVRANEFSFGPDSLAVTRSETITFEVTNSGSILHEFQLATATDVANHSAGDDSPSSDKLSLRPGESGVLTVTIDADATQFVCFVTGHYEAGMWGELTVP